MSWKQMGIGGVCFFLIIICLGSCSVCSYLHKAKMVVAQEIDPSFLLKKYEWFKDQSAALDAKMAQIETLINRRNDFDRRWEKVEIAQIPESALARRDQAETELAGVISKYNTMVAEYNAQMAKVNWAFCNVGQLPKGISQSLPREYREYRSQ